jgi:hypothetical protein
MLTAAFKSRSCFVLQEAQVHSRVSRPKLALSPHAEQVLLEAKNRSTLVKDLPYHLHLYSILESFKLIHTGKEKAGGLDRLISFKLYSY